MPKVSCYLSENTIEDIKKIADKEAKSQSRIMSDMIELGLKVHHHSEQNEEISAADKWEAVYQKMCYAQLQSLEMIKDIFISSVDPSQFNAQSHEEMTSVINTTVNSYIKGLLDRAV